MKVGIIGLGMVGGALKRYYDSVHDVETAGYDPYKGYEDFEPVVQSDHVFVAVPTPYDEETHVYDTSYIVTVLEKLAENSFSGGVIFRSTILPGTTSSLQEKYPQLKLMFNPEFLTEATADVDMRNPDRQLLGVTEISKELADEVMSLLPDAPHKKIMGATEAEMVKIFNNCFYAVKVIYANQMFDLCEKLGVDYDAVADSAGAAKLMTGPNHLTVWHKGYRGYGGICLPKDSKATIGLGEKHGVDLSVLREADAYNNVLRKDNLERDLKLGHGRNNS